MCPLFPRINCQLNSSVGGYSLQTRLIQLLHRLLISLIQGTGSQSQSRSHKYSLEKIAPSRFLLQANPQHVQSRKITKTAIIGPIISILWSSKLQRGRSQRTIRKGYRRRVGWVIKLLEIVEKLLHWIVIVEYSTHVMKLNREFHGTEPLNHCSACYNYRWLFQVTCEMRLNAIRWWPEQPRPR